MARFLTQNLPSNSNHESDFWFVFNEERSGSLGVSLSLDDGSISSLVLFVVLLSIS
jgi:hypothetical protein